MTTVFKTTIISNKDSRVIRMGFDEHEAWFEIQAINVEPQSGIAKLKILRIDMSEADAICNFIKVTKKDFTKRTKNFDNLLSNEENYL